MTDDTTADDLQAQAIEAAIAEHNRKQAAQRRKMSAASLFAMAAALGAAVPMPSGLLGRAHRGPKQPDPVDTAAIDAAQRKRDRKAVKAQRDAARAAGGGR